MRRVVLVLTVGILTLNPLSAASKPAAWTPELMMKVKDLTSIQVSPDGKKVAYAVRQAIMEGNKSEYLTHIYLANVDGSDTFQLTQGEKPCEQPQWSPSCRAGRASRTSG